ncbi:alpha/beta hydrolase [Sphingomonas ginkgonis]|uniref:Alpha/beta hydrolase n=1 Tax=Sphingomonas ginkgonis TaxID=2315330 RepID=A0A429V7Q6_9SPHN|nr:alpha/beta hydrolase [Sphingomonas ginkgonis]RST29975.1 alpha/beta hydrolase [Sphingomonas ginkgonis]
MTARLTRRALVAGAFATLALAACSPAGLLNGASSLAGADRAHRAAAGKPFGPDPRLKLDVWVPDRRPAGPLPVVVFFYGGGWVAGNRGDYGFAGRALAARGFIAVVPDYRLVPEVRFPTFLQDGAAAVRWVHDNIARFGGDPNRIALSGHSAGAYNAAMLALDPHFLADAGLPPRTIKAAALLSGPYDFYPFTEQRGRDALGAWPRPLETQPVHFVRRDAPPLLLLHGSADEVVEPRNSIALADALRRAGATVELRIYPGQSHIDLAKALSPLFRRSNPALADSARFLALHDRP